MVNIDLLNNAIDILIRNGISTIDLNFIQKYKHEVLSDDITDESRNLFVTIKKCKKGLIKSILMYSRTHQGFWNIRALWVNPEYRNQKIASGLLTDFRRICKNAKDVVVFVPFNDQRSSLSKLLTRNGYKHRRYIASISASEYNSIW